MCTRINLMYTFNVHYIYIIKSGICKLIYKLSDVLLYPQKNKIYQIPDRFWLGSKNIIKYGFIKH